MKIGEINSILPSNLLEKPKKQKNRITQILKMY